MKHSLSIVIPLYNESERLGTTFAALKKLSLPSSFILDEIIFVNDGSTDKSLRLVEQFANRHSRESGNPGDRSPIKSGMTSIKLVTYKKNRGKGYAVRQGMLASKADYTLLTDADMSTPLEELIKFEKFVKKNAHIMIGTRKNGHSTVVVHQPMYRELMGKCFTKLSQLILNTWVTDFTCGFKLFSREAAIKLFTRAQIDRWGYDAEIIFLSRKANYTIVEIPVTWSNDQRTKVTLLKDSFQSFKELLLIRKTDLSGRYTSTSAPSLA